MIIKSNEGAMFYLTTEQAVLSNIIKDMIENCTQNEIILDSISSKSLQKIVEFMIHETDTETEKLPDNILLIKDTVGIVCMNVDKWYSDFLNLNKDFNIYDLKNLTNAANYLDINDLLELCCAKIASILKGKSKEEMRSLINLENDFSVSEEKEIKREHEWVHLLKVVE